MSLIEREILSGGNWEAVMEVAAVSQRMDHHVPSKATIDNCYVACRAAS